MLRIRFQLRSGLIRTAPSCQSFQDAPTSQMGHGFSNLYFSFGATPAALRYSTCFMTSALSSSPFQMQPRRQRRWLPFPRCWSLKGVLTGPLAALDMLCISGWGWFGVRIGAP